MNAASFQDLALNWIITCLIKGRVQPVLNVLSLLLDTGCLIFSAFLDGIDEKCRVANVAEDCAQLAASTLELIFVPSDDGRDGDAREVCANHSTLNYMSSYQFAVDDAQLPSLLRLFHRALRLSGDVDACALSRIQRLTSNPQALLKLRRALKLDPATFKSELNLSAFPQDPGVCLNARYLVGKLVDPEGYLSEAL